MECDVNIRYHFFCNIMLSGGNTLLNGICERLHKELNYLTVNHKNAKIKIVAPPERKYSSWIGGSIIASLNTFEQIKFSKNDYLEYGSLAIHRLTQNENTFNLEYAQYKREKFTNECLMNLDDENDKGMKFMNGYLRTLNIFHLYIGAHDDIKRLIWRYIANESIYNLKLKALMKANKALETVSNENKKKCESMEQAFEYLNIDTNESLNALKTEFDQNKLNENKMLIQIKKLQKKNNSLKESVDQIMIKCNALKQSDNVKSNDNVNWTQKETLCWILSLNDGEFIKYDNTLIDAFKENEINGEYLANITKKDIGEWGIKHFKHRLSLFRHIQKLTKQ